jgi:hypothetical protein
VPAHAPTTLLAREQRSELGERSGDGTGEALLVVRDPRG